MNNPLGDKISEPVPEPVSKPDSWVPASTPGYLKNTATDAIKRADYPEHFIKKNP